MKGTTNIPGVCVLIRRKNTCLFVLRKNTGWKDGEYGLPGGHVEPDETFVNAVIREVKEETGLDIQSNHVHYLLTAHRKSTDSIRIDLYFEVSEWEGKPKNAEPDVHEEIAWLDLNALPPNVMDYMRAGLTSIKNGETYSEFGWAN